MKKSKWSQEQKLAIVIEGIKGQSSMSEICRKNGISQSQYYKWRDKFIEGGTKALVFNSTNGDALFKARIEELEKSLGRATMKYDMLKKNEELLGH